MLPNERVFEATAHVGNERQLARSMRPALSHDHLIRISVNYQVGIVCHDDDLTPLFSITEAMYQLLEDRLRVQVFFGLVDDQRPVVFRINGQVQQ